MATNINSFAESSRKLVESTNVALQSIVSLNTSYTTQQDVVPVSVNVIDPITGDTSLATYNIPSFNYMLNKLNTVSNSMDAFLSGNAKVYLNDGTYREVKVNPIAIAPQKITGLTVPSKFYTTNNWFFESLMFPKLNVEFNLKNRIDDTADKIYIKRVIFDNTNEDETNWFLSNIVGTTRNYSDTITFLANNSKNYWEDEQVQDLPLLNTPYVGSFLITNIASIDGVEWLYLDTLSYGATSDTSIINNYQLVVGDYVRFGENTVLKVDDIVVSENRISVITYIGFSIPAIGSTLNYYSIPFSEKLAKIDIGYNECNILFIKGVNENYNIIGTEWSDGLAFWTNSLLFEDSTITLDDYYKQYVVDFGKQMEGQAKEKFIPAYFGETPNAPVLSSTDFKVDRIDKQINAALDTQSIITTQQTVSSTSSALQSIKNTLSRQRSQLIDIRDPNQRAVLKKQISENIDRQSKLTIQYNSAVDTLLTYSKQNNAVASTPKYRVQGFFNIPDPKYTNNDTNAQAQEIIQFEIAYRYLREDGTANPLYTYSLTDPSSGQIVIGTKTDWEIVQSSVRQREYDETTDSYIWTDENIQDGQAININQVSIPIKRGEKAEFKVRSISEAGWPLNPKKSEWSNSVVMDFPSNAQETDQVTTILTNAASQQTSIELQRTLDSAGVSSHLNDTIPNPDNATTGVYFKHTAANIGLDVTSKTVANVIESTSTKAIQDIFDDIGANTYLTITKPSGATSSAASKTATLQQILQVLFDKTPLAYDEIE